MQGDLYLPEDGPEENTGKLDQTGPAENGQKNTDIKETETSE